MRWRLDARTLAEKSIAYDRVYWSLRARPEGELLYVVGELARRAAVSTAAVVDQLFMDWHVVAFSQHPLVSVGAHSVTTGGWRNSALRTLGRRWRAPGPPSRHA